MLRGSQVAKATLEARRIALFWLARIWLFLRSWQYPLQLRLMELGGQVVFMLCGIGKRDSHAALEQAARAADAGQLPLGERDPPRIRRWVWDSVHAWIARPASLAAHKGVFSVDVQAMPHCKVRLFQPTTGRVHELRANPRFRRLRPILFCHGGGFCLNSSDTMTHHDWCERLAAEGFVIASVDYRLAPEHPFPAALCDAYESLKWLVSPAATPFLPEGLDTSEVVLAGDSAGGNFTAVIAALARDGLDVDLQPCDALANVRILRQVIIYGALFHYPPLPSMTACMDGSQVFPFLSKDAMHWFLEAYLGSLDLQAAASDRRVSIWRAGLHGLPPTTIFTGDDPLRDENELFARRLREQGTPVSLHHHPSVHGYMTFDFLDVADRAFDQLLGDLAPLTHAA